MTLIRYLTAGPAGPGSPGGVRKLHDHVAILRAAGFDVVGTPVHEYRRAKGELTVIPEVYGSVMPHLYGPWVCLNQNANYTWYGVGLGEHPYVAHADLRAVLVMSERDRQAIRWAFPHVTVHRIYNSLEPYRRFRCSEQRERVVCTFTKKRPDDAALVLGLLATRPELEGWTVARMDGYSDEEVATVMATASIFLSFQHREGFGCPALEAMASGCLPIGYTGGAAELEYFRLPYAVPIDEGQPFQFAQTVTHYAVAIDRGDHVVDEASRAARWARDTWTRDREISTLVATFRQILDDL